MIFDIEPDNELDRLKEENIRIRHMYDSVSHNSKTTYRRYLKQVEENAKLQIEIDRLKQIIQELVK